MRLISAVTGRQSIMPYAKSFAWGVCAWAAWIICAWVCLIQPNSVLAQTTSFLNDQNQIPQKSKMLLEADELIYNNDQDIVTAKGNVKIHYSGYRLSADQVEYHQKSKKVVAVGNVIIHEANGNIVQSGRIELTEDLKDGFIESLHVKGKELGRFAAHSADRKDDVTTFHRGVYTACEPCKDNPEKPAFWRVRAKTIIHDKKKQTVRYENATLQILGQSVLWLPFFSHPDEFAKRKTGFLLPSLRQSDALGIGVSAPYFIDLAPNYDLTLTPHVYSRQGILGDIEWRHKLNKLTYDLRGMGIHQLTPEKFGDSKANTDWRYGMISKGRMDINSSWNAGWNAIFSSDPTFLRDYEYTTQSYGTNELYLSGLDGQNYFDARGYYFKAMTETENAQEKQAAVHPVIDYERVFSLPEKNQAITFTSNITSLSRDENDSGIINGVDYNRGQAGTQTRVSAELSWQKRFISKMGMLITPEISIYGDAIYREDHEKSTLTGTDELVLRGAPTASVDIAWPFLAKTETSSHTIQPRGQIIASLDEKSFNSYGNEDAQSLVFESSNLFSTDRFSGFDRREGGIRANAGLEYIGHWTNGAYVNLFAGQSYHLFGQNSFQLDDQTLVGKSSGLESTVSDFVAHAIIKPIKPITMMAKARFNHKDFSPERIEASVNGKYKRLELAAGYDFINTQPGLGYDDQRSQANLTAKLNLTESWHVKGGLSYDFTNRSAVSSLVEFGYGDECTKFIARYNQTFDRYTSLVDNKSIYVGLELNTLGSINQEYNLDVE